MPFFSDYLESGVLSHLFRTDTLPKPGAIGVALCGTAPADSDTVLTGKELANAGAYARQVTGPSDATWSFTFTNGSGSVTNVATITFPVATADWGWISGVALTNSGVYGAGAYLVGGSLAVPKLIGNGDQFKLNPGDITLYLD